jgi:hypothetical protein
MIRNALAVVFKPLINLHRRTTTANLTRLGNTETTQTNQYHTNKQMKKTNHNNFHIVHLQLI